MPERRPSFQFYPKDWLASTRGLSGAARGYHADLLALSWLNGGLDTDPEILRRSVGAEKAEWRRVWPELAPRWREVAGRLVHPRLEQVRQEAMAFAEAKRQAGKKGGKATAAGKQTASSAAADVAAKSSSSSSTPSTTTAKSAVVDARATDHGELPTRKRRLAHAWEARRPGLGVPHTLHRDLLSKMAIPDESALMAWYGATEDAWQGRAIGDTVWDFWNARFSEWQGTTMASAKVAGLAGGGRPAHTPRSVAVVDPDSRYRFHCAHAPTCERWSQHRDLLNADEEASA